MHNNDIAASKRLATLKVVPLVKDGRPLGIVVSVVVVGVAVIAACHRFDPQRRSPTELHRLAETMARGGDGSR